MSSPYEGLEREALICGRCGNCRSVCPVYHVIGWESSTPRGKISIAKEVFARGEQKTIEDEFVQRATQCTLCGACSNVCSTCIDTRSLWLELRKKIAGAGKAPDAYVNLKNNLLEKKNISNFSNDDRLEWAEDLDIDPEEIDNQEDAEVCYFVGCVSSFYPQAASIPLAICEILSEAGVNYTTMGGQEWCCGYPLLSAGFADDVEPFVEHNTDRVKELGVKTLITSCATCYNFWKNECQEALQGYDLEVLHVSEYLARLIREGRIELNEMDEVVTYHDPCDLGRNGGIFEDPREIIQSIPEVQFVELKHHHADSMCCGGGGNLQSVDPGLASNITALRIEEVKETGATLLVSSCQQCEQMLRAEIKKQGLNVRVVDISELVLEAMG